jgi:hypothetical protein
MITSSMQYAPTDQGEAGAPQTEDADTADVLDEFNRRFKHAKSHWKDWRDEARNLYDLIAGRQWAPEDEAKLKDELRPMVTFNVSGKYMDVITGLQINNRQETRFYPRKPGQAAADELLNGAVNWARDLCDQADDETDAFFDSALTGLGWMEGYLDKDLEPTGVPAGQRVDPLEMFPDPSARKRNLADAGYLIRIKYVTDDEYKELCGEDYAPSDRELADIDTDDDNLQLIEEPQDYREDSNTAQASTKRNKCAVADYQFWKREERYQVQHPQLGSKELTVEEAAAYEPFFKKAAQNGQVFQVQKIRRKVFYRAFIAHGKVCKYGLSPYQHGFTYHAITGKRDRNVNTWFGIGRSILDPQKWLNKFFSTILYVMMTNAKGGIMAEENTFKDARKAESEWANPNSITWLKDGALAKGKIEPKPPAVYPQGLDRLMDFTLNSLPQTTGLNVELMGLAEKVQAGVVEAQRKQSAMAIIAWAFDSMRRYYRSIGRQQARYVIDYMPEKTLIMITGQEGKQYVPLVKSNLPFEFDIIVDEAPTSVNMKERVWLVLEGLIPQLLQAGLTIPPDVLDYSPLPTDLVQKWKQALKPDPQKQQFDIKSALASLQKLMAEGHEKEASAKLKEAQAQEAGAKSQEHVASALEKAALAGQAQAHPF